MLTKKIFVGSLTAIALALSANVNAAQGSGNVYFKGTVINAPCGIAPESADQTIDFGQISKTHLDNNGISIQKDLDIKLVNCDLTDPNAGKTVSVTFSGQTVNGTQTELLTAGPTQTAIVINGYNKDVVFNTPTDAIKLVDGNNTLHFTSWVKKATSAQNVEEGDFSAVASFNLTYQ